MATLVSGYSEGVDLGLLQSEKIVPDNVGNTPEKNDTEKSDESGAVIHDRCESQHNGKPVDNVIEHKKKLQGMRSLELYRVGVCSLFSFPDEPPGRMIFDDRSVYGPQGEHAHEPPEVGDDIGSQKNTGIDQSRNPQGSGQHIVPSPGQDLS